MTAPKSEISTYWLKTQSKFEKSFSSRKNAVVESGKLH